MKGVNQAHGLRRTNDDKRKAVMAALRHPKGAKMSDTQIAEHVGVDVKTVGKYRSELESSMEIPEITTRTVTRGGKTYEQNTANIGKASATELPSRRCGFADRSKGVFEYTNCLSFITRLSPTIQPRRNCLPRCRERKLAEKK